MNSSIKIISIFLFCVFLPLFLFSLNIQAYTVSYYLPFFLVLILWTAILFVLLIKERNGDLFSPVCLFSFYYMLLPIAGFYYVYKGIDRIPRLHGFSTIEYFQYFNISFLLCIAGFISFTSGYYLFKGKGTIHGMVFEKESALNSVILRTVIFSYFSIGISSFLYVSSISSGNPVNFLLEIGKQSSRYSDSNVSTIGFHFLYSSMFLWNFL